MIKKIAINLLKILLATTLILTIILITIDNTILKEQYLKDFLVKKDYYKLTYESIKKEFAIYAPRLHIEDEETNLDEIATLKMVTNDINKIISCTYNNKQIKIDTTQLKENLTKLIDEKLKKHSITPTEEEKKYLEKFKKTIIKAYENKIFLYTQKHINKIPTKLDTTTKTLKNIIKILLIIDIALILLITLIEKNIKKTNKDLITVFFTITILSIIIRTVAVKRTSNILILSNDASMIIKEIIKDTTGIILLVGIILGIIGLFGIIIGLEELNNSKKKGRKK